MAPDNDGEKSIEESIETEIETTQSENVKTTKKDENKNARRKHIKLAKKSKKKRKKKRKEGNEKKEASIKATIKEEKILMATVPFSCKTVEDAVLHHMQMMRERMEEDERDTTTPEPMNKVEQIAARLHDDKDMDKLMEEIYDTNFLNIDDREGGKGNSLPSNDGSDSLCRRIVSTYVESTYVAVRT